MARLRGAACLAAIWVSGAALAFGAGTESAATSRVESTAQRRERPAQSATARHRTSERQQQVPVDSGDKLIAAEVVRIVEAAVAASNDPAMTVAVVDRVGTILALFRKPGADTANDDTAVGLARTAAFFSNDMAPLSSRTVRFISGINFPPGVMDTPNAALYGIENTNRGCDLNVAFNGQVVPRAKSVMGTQMGLLCNSIDQSGCGTGPVTGKIQPRDDDPAAVNPGGVPVFRLAQGGTSGALLGGIGITGIPPRHAEYIAFRAAFAGAGGADQTAPVPIFPLPPPGNVFIDGVRLPFVEQVSRPADLVSGAVQGSYVMPFVGTDGVPAPDGYLVGPTGSPELTEPEVRQIVQQSIAAASRTRAVIRLPLGTCARMIIAVSDLDGELLAIYRMTDATLFSLDVAASKARNVVYFSDPTTTDLHDLANQNDALPLGTAITNRTISFGAQPLFPPGINSHDPHPGPFFEIFKHDHDFPCSQGFALPDPSLRQSGVVFFPGSMPLYRDGVLVGGLGISGDGVEQDDYVAYLGAAGYLPPEAIQSNQVFVDGVRLPFVKFPRNPEACTP